jgi:hypothetical protein
MWTRWIGGGAVVVMAICGLALPAGAWPARPAAPATPTACPQSIKDRYEPGDEVKVVGYGCLNRLPELTADSKPLYGYLHRDPCAGATVACSPHAPVHVDPTKGLRLGRFQLEDTAHEPRGLRMSLTFRLPADLAAGVWYVLVCENPCPTELPDPPAEPLYVGVDPPAGQRPVRAWPLDDPVLVQLADDALVYGPDGKPATAAEVRGATTVTTTGARDAGGGGDRVETTAAPAADHHGPGPGPPLVWAGVLALLVVAWRLVVRRGARVKQVRHPPGGRPHRP